MEPGHLLVSFYDVQLATNWLYIALYGTEQKSTKIVIRRPEMRSETHPLIDIIRSWVRNGDCPSTSKPGKRKPFRAACQRWQEKKSRFCGEIQAPKSASSNISSYDRIVSPVRSHMMPLIGAPSQQIKDCHTHRSSNSAFSCKSAFARLEQRMSCTFGEELPYRCTKMVANYTSCIY